MEIRRKNALNQSMSICSHELTRWLNLTRHRHYKSSRLRQTTGRWQREGQRQGQGETATAAA